MSKRKRPKHKPKRPKQRKSFTKPGLNDPFFQITPLLYVEWCDANAKFCSVGFLLSSKGGRISLAQSIGDYDRISGVINLPSKVVILVRRL